jgi:hypothetical protein
VIDDEHNHPFLALQLQAELFAKRRRSLVRRPQHSRLAQRRLDCFRDWKLPERTRETVTMLDEWSELLGSIVPRASSRLEHTFG